jgi:hypothetical protein
MSSRVSDVRRRGETWRGHPERPDPSGRLSDLILYIEPPGAADMRQFTCRDKADAWLRVIRSQREEPRNSQTRRGGSAPPGVPSMFDSLEVKILYPT